jgi:hypothetical protein
LDEPWLLIDGQDIEVGYFHTYKDGVDFVFIDSSIFHAVASNIYGGSHEVPLIPLLTMLYMKLCSVEVQFCGWWQLLSHYCLTIVLNYSYAFV